MSRKLGMLQFSGNTAWFSCFVWQDMIKQANIAAIAKKRKELGTVHFIIVVFYLKLKKIMVIKLVIQIKMGVIKLRHIFMI